MSSKELLAIIKVKEALYEAEEYRNSKIAIEGQKTDSEKGIVRFTKHLRFNRVIKVLSTLMYTKKERDLNNGE